MAGVLKFVYSLLSEALFWKQIFFPFLEKDGFQNILVTSLIEITGWVPGGLFLTLRTKSRPRFPPAAPQLSRM